MDIKTCSRISFIFFVLLFFTALICTILGGVVLPWTHRPLDEYVLFIGQLAHVFSILSGGIAIVFMIFREGGLKSNKDKVILFVTIFLLVIIIAVFVLTRQDLIPSFPFKQFSRAGGHI